MLVATRQRTLMDMSAQVMRGCCHVIEVPKCPRNEQVVGSIPTGGSRRERNSNKSNS
jgi:hypothetical protein